MFPPVFSQKGFNISNTTIQVANWINIYIERFHLDFTGKGLTFLIQQFRS